MASYKFDNNAIKHRSKQIELQTKYTTEQLYEIANSCAIAKGYKPIPINAKTGKTTKSKTALVNLLIDEGCNTSLGLYYDNDSFDFEMPSPISSPPVRKRRSIPLSKSPLKKTTSALSSRSSRIPSRKPASALSRVHYTDKPPPPKKRKTSIPPSRSPLKKTTSVPSSLRKPLTRKSSSALSRVQYTDAVLPIKIVPLAPKKKATPFKLAKSTPRLLIKSMLENAKSGRTSLRSYEEIFSIMKYLIHKYSKKIPASEGAVTLKVLKSKLRAKCGVKYTSSNSEEILRKIGKIILSRTGRKFSKDSLNVLSNIVYNDALTIIKLAVLNVNNAGRKTLFPKDLQLAHHSMKTSRSSHSR